MSASGGLPAAIYRGTCTGHGVCIPANIHATVSCGTPCKAVPKKPVAAMDATNHWLPQLLAPLQPVSPTVLIEGIAPILDADILMPHKSVCTQLVAFVCKTPPPPKPCPTADLTAEDFANGGAHTRIAKATTKSVWINGKRACRQQDPLGPPCLSTIAVGAPTVTIGI